MYTHGGFLSMYGKNHYNIVISLQLKKKKIQNHGDVDLKGASTRPVLGVYTWGTFEAPERCDLCTICSFNAISSRADLKELIVYPFSIMWLFEILPHSPNTFISCPRLQLSRATQFNQNEISCFEIKLAE